MGIVSTRPALPSTTVKRRSRAIMRSGVFTVSAIGNPQIDEEKKSRMEGKKSPAVRAFKAFYVPGIP
jgi:hypothetical protein